MILIAVIVLTALIGLIIAHQQVNNRQLLPYVIGFSIGYGVWTLSVVYVRRYMSGMQNILFEYIKAPVELAKSNEDISRSSLSEG